MTDKPDIFFPLYIGDYRRDTARLTTLEHGAYLLIIMDYWVNGPPPDDDQILARVAGLPNDAWSNARSSLASFFHIADGVWRHKRIDHERNRAKASKNKAVSKAKTAANARWAGKKHAPSIAPSNARSNAQAMPITFREGDALTEQSPSTGDAARSLEKRAALPASVRGEFVDELGETFVGTWMDRGAWTDIPRSFQPKTVTAFDTIRRDARARDKLSQLGIELLAPRKKTA